MSDKPYQGEFPFRLDHDSGMNEWFVFLEHPEDENNFVVVYADEEFENCHPVCSALNDLFQAHLEHAFLKKRIDWANENGEIES